MAKLLLSFDFEDWHQLVHRGLGHADWDARGHALERQTAAIFELLDELGAKATFFVLGITAERYPDLVRSIAGKGQHRACGEEQFGGVGDRAFERCGERQEGQVSDATCRRRQLPARGGRSRSRSACTGLVSSAPEA